MDYEVFKSGCCSVFSSDAKFRAAAKALRDVLGRSARYEAITVSRVFAEPCDESERLIAAMRALGGTVEVTRFSYPDQPSRICRSCDLLIEGVRFGLAEWSPAETSVVAGIVHTHESKFWTQKL